MYDVAVFGGGPAGCACAHTACAHGLKTIIIEKNNYLGGQMTGGLVVPVMKSNSHSLNTDFYSALIASADKYNARITYGDGNKGWFNPIILKIVLDSMLKSSGCDILLESEPQYIDSQCNDIISVQVKCGLLSIPIEAKYYVDATGDCNFSKLANCEFWNDSKKSQAPSLRFLMSNINIKKFEEFILKTDFNRDVTNSFEINDDIYLTTAYTSDESQIWNLRPIFKKAVEIGDLKEFDASYFQLFSVAESPGTIAFNCPRLEAFGNNPIVNSMIIIKGRESMLRIARFCKKYLPGFENAYISNIADITGIRESKRLKCRYDYKVEDIYSQKTFENPVLYSDYPIDIHSDEKDGSVLKKVKTYSLPIESLISKDYNNLFAAGRNVGADYKAQAALRVQGSCMSMGEGVAKYISNLASL